MKGIWWLSWRRGNNEECCYRMSKDDPEELLALVANFFQTSPVLSSSSSSSVSQIKTRRVWRWGTSCHFGKLEFLPCMCALLLFILDLNAILMSEQRETHKLIWTDHTWIIPAIQPATQDTHIWDTWALMDMSYTHSETHTVWHVLATLAGIMGALKSLIDSPYVRQTLAGSAEENERGVSMKMWLHHIKVVISWGLIIIIISPSPIPLSSQYSSSNPLLNIVGVL